MILVLTALCMYCSLMAEQEKCLVMKKSCLVRLPVQLRCNGLTFYPM